MIAAYIQYSKDKLILNIQDFLYDAAQTCQKFPPMNPAQ
jgi:hypothetical protein